MVAEITVKPINSRRDLIAFVKFPWRVYKDDPNWVPPLISEQVKTLSPSSGAFYKNADLSLLLAKRGREVVGTIAVFIDHLVNKNREEKEGGFGFIEFIKDYQVAKALLDAACDWLRVRNVHLMRGPLCFTQHECAGILIDGANCPPAMMEAHSPPYYKEFLEKYGMEKFHDLYAWRAFREQIGEELKNIPPELSRVAEAARRAAKVTLRKIDMSKWDEEVRTTHFLFNTTLRHIPDHVDMTEADFRRIVDDIRPFLDPDLVLFAEVDGKPIGFCAAIPDINRVLIHLNGRLFPFGILKINRLIKQIDVVSFKLMGVLEEYRRRGIDALLYLEAVKAVYEKGYAWLDGSITSELNPMVNLIANRLGAERYKHYRLYEKRF